MDFIARLPIESFWGVGPVTAKKMHSLGIHNGEQLRACSQAMLLREFGKEEAEACRETTRKRQQLFEAGVRKYLDQGNEVI